MRATYATTAFLQWVSLIGFLGCFGATGAAHAQAVDLLGLGVNANFETPDLPDGTGESTAARNLGPGWTFSLLGGASGDYGVQDPADGFYGAHPLPAPFDGRQIGFMNLDAYSAGELVSKPIGAIQAGQTYALNVAVGARNAAAWPTQRYYIGLRTIGGTDLGTFATIDMVPGASPTNIADLQYSLNVNSQAAAFAGQDVRIVIKGVNLSVINGVETAAFTQPNFDNVRLTGTLATANSPLITINRTTGAISLSKTGTTNLNIAGYSLTSAAGSFNSAAWTSIANTYDKNSAPTPGNGTVDSDDAWTILSAAGSSLALSEGELEAGAGDGGTLSNAAPINLGNVWRKTPFEDVQAKLSLVGGSTLDVQVQYTGAAIPSGDLTGDAAITGADWTAFKNGQGTDFSSLSTAQAYLKGDLNGDGSHDLQDFLLFRTAYEMNNGAGSFATLLGVPEPSTFVMLACGSLLGGVVCRRRATQVRRRVTYSRRRLPIAKLVLVWSMGLCIWVSADGTVQAQGIVAHWSFDSDSLTADGSGNITGLAETSGNHNASTASGTFLPTDSVTGKFGNGLRFNGDNHLDYPILTELTKSHGAPSYTTSMWVKWLNAAAPTSATPFSTMSNWGNGGAGTDGVDARFTYAFGPASGTSVRAQTRYAATPNGTDIYGRTVTTSSIVDGAWHMLTWTFDTTSGTLNTYFDGSNVQTYQAPGASFELAESTSAVGSFGFKADNSLYLTADTQLDEIWVLDGALDATQVTNLFQTNAPPAPPTLLTLRVDPLTGHTMLRNDSDGNPSDDPITFNSYRITSAGNSLDSSGWTPMADQSVAGFPPGNGTGNGWESGPGSSSKELTEWYLLGDSTLNKGQSVDLGFAYDKAVNAHDLAVRYLTPDGTERSAKVVYASIGSAVPGDYSGNGVVDAADYTIWRDHLNQSYQLMNEGAGQTPGTVTSEDYNFWKSHFGESGSGSGSLDNTSAVPEPSAGLMLALSGGILMCFVSKPRTSFLAMCVGPMCSAMIVAALLVCGLDNSASAAYTIDRLYHFGEDSLEHGAPGADVGSLSTAGANTLDSMGPSLAYIDLAPNGVTGLPKYIDVSAIGPGLAQARPGAASGGLGIKFDGVDDFLSGLQFGYPSNAPGTHLFTPSPGPNNYDGVITEGFQLWVYPDSAGSASSQHIVMNTRQHGLRTNTQGEWALVYNNNEVDSNVDVNFNEWSHVMVAMPGTLPNREVLYVNGVAVAARQSNYTTSAAEMAYSLVVGASTGNTDPTVGTGNRFNGVLDELTMFAWGNVYDSTTNTVTSLGQFNFATDNEYVATHLTGIPGDVNQMGGFTQADIDAFVAGWLSQRLVNNVQVGDLTSYGNGDLNFDGITDLGDMALLRAAIGGAGSGSFDLTAFNALAVPEPTALALCSAAIGMLLVGRARRPRLQ